MQGIMLKLYKPVRFNYNEYVHIQNVLMPLGAKAWDDTSRCTKQIKNHISRFTIRNQKGRCAYCEDILQYHCQIEHFVAKSLYNGMFSFTPLNLVTSCDSCNQIKRRKEFSNNVISGTGAANPRFKHNTFQIVNPYVDNPDQEIVFVAGGREIIDMPACTPKGRNTVDFFDLNSKPAILKRARPYTVISGETLHELIEYLSTYQ